MTINVKRVDIVSLSDEDRRSINAVLINSPNATVFHTIEWNSLLIDEFELQNITLLATLGAQPVGLYSFYQDGVLCQSSVHDLESVYGGPIWTPGHSEAASKLLEAAEKLQRKAWFSIWTPANYEISPLVERGYTDTEMYTSILDLQKSEQDLWAGLKSTARTRIRKARKSKVSVHLADASLIEAYYSMIVSTFSRVQIDILPHHFYRRVVKRFEETGMVRFLLAKHEGDFIAGAIFLCHKDTVYYWHGASYRERLDVAPNDLIFWEIIKWGSKKGYKYFDFLRVEPDRLPGIARFKMKFGGDMVPCYYLAKGTLGYKFSRITHYAKHPVEAWNKMRQVIKTAHDT